MVNLFTQNKGLIFLITFLLTSVVNWGIPVLIYFGKFGFSKRPKGFIGCNVWGVVMDVVLAGAINIVIMEYLMAVHPEMNISEILIALILGFVFMVVIHIFMAATYWKEWIMPRPWHWNAGGYWHMISMTVQMGYGFYPAVLIILRPGLIAQTITINTLIVTGVLCSLFLLALSFKNKDIKIGFVKISAQSW